MVPLESRTLNVLVFLIDRYSQILTELLQKLLVKIQFRFNESQLEEMDDEKLDNEVISNCA